MQLNMYYELIIFIIYLLKHTQSVQSDARVCSAVKIPMCIEMPYNTTRMPNLLRHRTQEEAAIMAHEFLPLVDIGCSPHVRFFICSVFAPMCTSKISFGVPSCRLVCLSVRESCLPVLMRLNFTWPPFLRCDLFPQDGLCMMPPNLNPHLGNPSLRFKETNLPKRISKPTFHQDFLRPISGDGNFMKEISNSAANVNWTLNFPYATSSVCSKGRVWIPIDDEHRICTPVCGEDFLFTAPEKRMAKLWVACWAFACLSSTSFTILTFCLDRKRFKYPERPVICLALSYFFYGLPFILSSLVSNEKLSCEADPVTGVKHLAVAGTSSSGCVASFLMQYYFGFASDLWWTILTFCWFMSSGRFWGSEGLSNFDTYFHLIAWGTPAVASVLVILFRQIDGDELTGLCFVGNLRPLSLLVFVIVPQCILVTLGTVFVLLGLLGLFRIRNIIRLQTATCNNAASSSLLSSSIVNQDRMTSPTFSTPTSNASLEVLKLERLMIRLGVYATLSTIPAALVLVFRLCFYFRYESWVEEASSECREGWNKNDCLQSQSRTVLSLFRLFMSLVVGVTSGIWVWSPKTFKIWRKTLTRICSFPIDRFSKTSNINNPAPQLAMGNLHSPEEISQLQQQCSSCNIAENSLAPSSFEHSRSTSTVRTSRISSRHHLLRNSESSFV